ncbi:gfo/Idh/MocA family oxidoreductase [Candidatus Parcubacteria bacterium]|jgi:predicted dehydrogenase|nr:MAG: gfo/Idh/MocA family oxidoreductase [Candidatus Parcubacteria bacterium]
MSNNKKKILFIGLGGIGQRHLRNVSAQFGDNTSMLAYRVRNLRQTVTANLTIDENADFIEKYSVEVFTDLDQALTQSPDVAFICNPSSLHIPSCLAVARVGCDFFVEKPLSDSLDGIEELIYICQSKGLIGLVGYQLRFHPCYKLLKELIRQGTIGNLLSIRAEVGEYLPDWHKYEDYRQMYASKKDLGGGVVLSQIHELDYLYDLFGMPRKIFTLGGHLSNLEIDAEDVADVLMEMTFNGKPLPVSVHMDYIQKPPSRNCKVIGESGKITMDLTGLKVIVEKPGKEKEIHDFGGFERNELFVSEIDHFFRCVATRQQTVVTIRDGLNSLKIALAVKQSMETGQIISIG